MSQLSAVGEKMESSLQNLHKILVESADRLTDENRALRKEVIRQEEIISALTRLVYQRMEKN